MSGPTQAKYCPRCHAMNHMEAERCTYCSHQFRTSIPSVTPSEEALDALKKTQMFTLPRLAPRHEARDNPPQAVGRQTRLVSLFVALRASPFFRAIVLLVTLILALICWAVMISR